jgi:hypothetical protein
MRDVLNHPYSDAKLLYNHGIPIMILNLKFDDGKEVDILRIVVNRKFN